MSVRTFSKGEKVTFSFFEDGVVRHGEGRIVSADPGGGVVVEFAYSNIKVTVLPDAIRKKSFTHSGFKRRLANLVEAAIDDSWSGSMMPEAAKESRDRYRKLDAQFKQYLKDMP